MGDLNINSALLGFDSDTLKYPDSPASSAVSVMVSLLPSPSLSVMEALT